MNEKNIKLHCLKKTLAFSVRVFRLLFFRAEQNIFLHRLRRIHHNLTGLPFYSNISILWIYNSLVNSNVLRYFSYMRLHSRYFQNIIGHQTDRGNNNTSSRGNILQWLFNANIRIFMPTGGNSIAGSLSYRRICTLNSNRYRSINTATAINSTTALIQINVLLGVF